MLYSFDLEEAFAGAGIGGDSHVHIRLGRGCSPRGRDSVVSLVQVPTPKLTILGLGKKTTALVCLFATFSSQRDLRSPSFEEVTKGY